MLDRRLMVIGLLSAMLPSTGCMTKPLRPVNADGTYCYRIGKPWRRYVTCTSQQVPSDAAEAEAKRFESDRTALTVYVVRNRWLDTRFVIPIAIDDRQVGADTTPVSLVRLRLAPGAHRLSFEWEGRHMHTSVEGVAGDVRFVHLVGASWSWGTTFEWAPIEPSSARSRGQAAKLVSDLDLRAQ